MMTVKRPIPCSLYDIQGMQDWLDEMALQGLFFQNFTRRNDAANFLVDAPRPVRYRLDPVGRSKQEDAKRKEPYAQMGWRFADAQPKLYYIFSCEDPEAPELHSDPQTLGYALDSAIRAQIRSFGLMWLIVALLLAAFLFLFRKSLLWELLLMEQPRPIVQVAWASVIILICGIAEGFQIRHLMKARRRLEQGLPMKAGRRWDRPRFLTVYLLLFCPLYLGVDLLVPRYLPEVCGLGERELSRSWPTLVQTEGTGPRPLAEEPEADGYLKINRSRLVPVQEYASIDWRVTYLDPDTGALTRPYTLWTGIQYDQARSSRAARLLYQLRLDAEARQLKKALDYNNPLSQVTGLQPWEELDWPGLDRLETVRFRRGGQDHWLFAALRGRDVLIVDYSGYASLEDCLPLFLASLDAADR